jgi:hypothetical protein
MLKNVRSGVGTCGRFGIEKLSFKEAKKIPKDQRHVLIEIRAAELKARKQVREERKRKLIERQLMFRGVKNALIMPAVQVFGFAQISTRSLGIKLEEMIAFYNPGQPIRMERLPF